MDEIRVSAKTVDDALTEALIQLRTTSDQVEYEVIEKGTSGFLGIGAKQAVINVRRKKPEKKEYKPEFREEKSYEPKAESPISEKEPEADKTERKPAEKRPVKKAEKPAEKEERKPQEKAAKEEPENLSAKKEKQISPLTDEEADVILEKAKSFLSDIFKAMNMEVEIEATVEKHTRLLNINLNGENMGILIGKHGQNLNSLEYLVRLVINKNHHGDEYIHVKMDTENYRRRRKNTLEILARNMAYKVKKTRRSVVLEPMNPYERRVIHSALQHDRFVETHSEGEEPNRRVVITLKKY